MGDGKGREGVASGEAQATWEAGKLIKKTGMKSRPLNPLASSPPPGASRGLREQTGQLELISTH